MAKPYIHSKNSAKKWGGTWEDYIDIHDFMDSSKANLADVRHRAILHTSFGIFIAEKVFGTVRLNSQGKEYSVRDIAEQHVLEDMGFIPTMQDYLTNLQYEDWMSGKGRPSSQDNLDKPKQTIPNLADYFEQINKPHVVPKTEEYTYPAFQPKVKD